VKKLLILLFSILISFNSYSGSLDDKGLRCEPKGINDERPMFVWFQDNTYSVPEIVGYQIKWSGRYSVRFIGTKEIDFLSHDDPGNLGWWEHKILNRETLQIRDVSDWKYKGNCKVIVSIEEIKDSLNEEIDAAKSVNKI
jgi:hypothetical protein